MLMKPLPSQYCENHPMSDSRAALHSSIHFATRCHMRVQRLQPRASVDGLCGLSVSFESAGLTVITLPPINMERDKGSLEKDNRLPGPPCQVPCYLVGGKLREVRAQMNKHNLSCQGNVYAKPSRDITSGHPAYTCLPKGAGQNVALNACEVRSAAKMTRQEQDRRMDQIMTRNAKATTKTGSTWALWNDGN